jgi:alkyl hydroperoxide reductase subunit AhpC
MATLTLSSTTDAASSSSTKARLRDWLDGKWAVLFSNPEDFAPHPTTPEGFITLLADDFAACGVKPITLGKGDGTTNSWLDFAGADTTNVVLDGDPEPAAIVDLAQRTLAKTIRRLTSRFVIVLDEKARCRTTINYDARRVAHHRTIEDVLNMVQVLQRRVPVATHQRHSRVAAG